MELNSGKYWLDSILIFVSVYEKKMENLSLGTRNSSVWKIVAERLLGTESFLCTNQTDDELGGSLNLLDEFLLIIG